MIKWLKNVIGICTVRIYFSAVDILYICGCINFLTATWLYNRRNPPPEIAGKFPQKRLRSR